MLKRLFRYDKSGERGFTLIELLVVIAIIGILASIVLSSLNSARRRSRDARRVAEIRQIQLALELYFDRWNAYPAATASCSASLQRGLELLETAGYMPSVPYDPNSVAGTEICYLYASDTTAAPANRNYHIGRPLEDDNVVLDSDRDFDSAAWTGAFNGNNDAGNNIYDQSNQ